VCGELGAVLDVFGTRSGPETAICATSSDLEATSPLSTPITVATSRRPDRTHVNTLSLLTRSMHMNRSAVAA
jgi:hypothetical protein